MSSEHQCTLWSRVHGQESGVREHWTQWSSAQNLGWLSLNSSALRCPMRQLESSSPSVSGEKGSINRRIRKLLTLAAVCSARWPQRDAQPYLQRPVQRELFEKWCSTEMLPLPDLPLGHVWKCHRLLRQCFVCLVFHFSFNWSNQESKYHRIKESLVKFA